KYFKQIGDMWQIDPRIRSMVEFKPANLLRDFGAVGVFDVIFCRNVLIYFDQPTKMEVLNRITDAMAPDGFLVLGASETTIGLSARLKTINGKRGLHGRHSTPGEHEPSPVALVRNTASRAKTA
ncbi:MAG: CheR family methyltransferase, partial [Hoeflea sp.]|nr:CheR family methyltransferase [Hoeflea sp.]